MGIRRWDELSENLSNYNRKRVAYTLLPTLADAIIEDEEMSSLDRGNAIMELLRDNLAKIYEHWRPTLHQRLVHEQICAALLRYVYKGDFYTNELLIKKLNSVTTTKTAVALTAPRRFGKTLALSMAVAAIFMSIPDFETVIVAQGSRSSGGELGILSKIRELLATCFGFDKFETGNKEGLIARFPDKRQIHAFSAHINNGFVSAKIVRFISVLCVLHIFMDSLFKCAQITIECGSSSWPWWAFLRGCRACRWARTSAPPPQSAT